MADGPQPSALSHDATLIAIIQRVALLWRAPKLVELAVGTPGFRIEARAGDRQDVPVAAAFWTVFRRTAPAARLELHHGGRLRRRFRPGLGGGGRGGRREQRVRHRTSF